MGPKSIHAIIGHQALEYFRHTEGVIRDIGHFPAEEGVNDSVPPGELCAKRIEILKADHGTRLGQLSGQEVGCGRAVRGRNVAKGGEANQALDIGSVRVDTKGVDEEDQHIQFTTRNQRTDLLVATERAAIDQFRVKAELRFQQ
jgi:hypothetical protein